MADVQPLFGHGTPVSLPYGLSVESTLLLETLAIAVVTVLWFLVLAAVLNFTRPKAVTPLAASQDMPGDEPPAVVSLIVNGWELNEDAVESTLLDLAARHFIELRQPGNDPLQTTVHLLPAPVESLNTYEQQVLSHIRTTAIDDVVPVTALTFRDKGQEQRWTTKLNSSVVDDARGRGLSQRRISPGLATALSVLAVLPAGLLALSIMERQRDFGAGLGGGVVAWGILSGLAGRPLGERDTPAGREAAARWLGLKAFLKNDEAFADLPPAAVAVWDRYLSYGDALGVTRICAAVLDLGMGDRRRVWSSFGSGWHPMRIRYPKVWGRYGKTAPKLLGWAALCLVIGGWLTKTFGGDFDRGDLPDGPLRTLYLIPALLGLYFLVRGVYRIVRTGADLAAPRTMTGEVLWVELWRSTDAKEDKPSVPIIDYLAIDDGSADRTTAWALPSAEAHRVHAGDVVTITVRPWSRRVTALTVDSKRSAQLVSAPEATPAPATAADATPAAQPALATPAQAAAAQAAPASEAGSSSSTVGVDLGVGSLVSAAVLASAASRATRPTQAIPVRGPLLDVDEVSTALGRPVTIDGAAAQVSLGPFELTTFCAGSDPVLVLGVARGRAVSLVMRGIRHVGTPLTGPAEEAYRGPGWVAARQGETMIRLNLSTPGPADEALPGLLHSVLTKITQPSP